MTRDFAVNMKSLRSKKPEWGPVHRSLGEHYTAQQATCFLVTFQNLTGPATSCNKGTGGGRPPKSDWGSNFHGTALPLTGTHAFRKVPRKVHSGADFPSGGQVPQRPEPMTGGGRLPKSGGGPIFPAGVGFPQRQNK